MAETKRPRRGVRVGGEGGVGSGNGATAGAITGAGVFVVLLLLPAFNGDMYSMWGAFIEIKVAQVVSQVNLVVVELFTKVLYVMFDDVLLMVAAADVRRCCCCGDGQDCVVCSCDVATGSATTTTIASKMITSIGNDKMVDKHLRRNIVPGNENELCVK